MFHGSMVAMVTPMHPDGAVDEVSLARLVDYHVEHGTDAIVAVGTTGESATLDYDEHCHVMRKVVEAARGRIPVIGGTGANSTWEAIKLTRCAMEGGCDATLLVVPYYNKPTQDGLYRHFAAIADAVAIPQILYNVPGRTACDLLPDTVDRLADISNIVGIKEASTIERVHDLVERCSDRLDVFSGEDGLSREAVLAGAKGVISVTANVAPQQMHDMVAAALRGDEEEASRIDARLAALHSALFLESNPIPVKWAVSQMGLCGPSIRLPLTELSEQHHETVRQAMKLAGSL
ncbi:4-hydroxy-tetrahydrodipicolinate synthase [Alkalilimnicola ehrlichii MLHE-1]|uniref:4-hydroxy-tetrahydrodipicolinate synthase n=1 Tax=Alkalilimnicola ehrlichii (strain ATCC BAA-1101 / DSM 17681 / MLHE-1) TaxID=187272 RepID=DAPA_ALKEH|nr:4-hydroxy-tetrahydrodipicolinate synthase [Alkalilimnicola ehrlichii]Q0A5S1.1 RecName: Full=4-hydroxy-tetrahydrodipicolinate synthase; Short=HTPA synthase [Alkalilimnicola ehrlichii MLHE-1]ABI57816.1 dihydrodipicolinate synthase [Alkalilimnicola ehrlichii MLHE-1]